MDTTAKCLNICSRLMNAADQLMKAVQDLSNLKDEKESSGLDLAAKGNVDALAGSSLKHATGDDFNNVLSSGAALKKWLEDNFHDDNFQKVRP